MRKIKKGDDVVVKVGKDSGKRGTVLRVLPDVDKLVVENVNIAKKHTKPNPQAGIPGGARSRGRGARRAASPCGNAEGYG